MTMLHERKNPRLRNYDYSSSGMYFVTICSKDRECVFGEVNEGVFSRFAAGEIIQRELEELPAHYYNIGVDSYVIMPNHIHVIICIWDAKTVAAGAPRREGAPRRASTGDGDEPKTGGIHVRRTLGEIICGFKAGVTRKYGRRVWQRGYHEHIIRNEADLQEIREYIKNNPIKWDIDSQQPGQPEIQ